MNGSDAGSATATQHDAPPAFRPMSGGAVTAIVLAFLLILPAVLGLWWLEGLPVLIAALSWGPISDGRRRGGGIAIAACVIAILAGLGCLAIHRGVASKIESKAGEILTAIQKDDRALLEPWAVEGPDKAERLARWRSRMAEAEKVAGPFAGSTSARMGMLGPMVSMMLPPEGPTEVGEGSGAKPEVGSTVWIEAKFSRESLWVAFEVNQEEATGSSVEKAVQGGHPPPILREVRFFRAAP